MTDKLIVLEALGARAIRFDPLPDKWIRPRYIAELYVVRER